MNRGLWIWPSDPRGQRKVLTTVAASPHLMAAMTALSKSKEGMSDSELNEAVSDTSEWTTLWAVRQLTSLGFIEYRVDFFGNPAKYQLTEAGQTAFAAMTGKQLLQKPPSPSPPVPSSAPQPAAPKPA